MSRSPSLKSCPQGRTVNPDSLCVFSFQREVQCSRYLQISAAEDLAWLCHSRAAQTFLPAVESSQTCPAQSPLLEESVAKTARFFRNIYNGEMKGLPHSRGQKYLVSQVMNKSLFLCFVCFPLLSKKKKVELQSEVGSGTSRLVLRRASELLGSWSRSMFCSIS